MSPKLQFKSDAVKGLERLKRQEKLEDYLQRQSEISVAESEVNALISHLCEAFDFDIVYSAIKIHVLFMEMSFKDNKSHQLDRVRIEVERRVKTHSTYRSFRELEQE